MFPLREMFQGRRAAGAFEDHRRNGRKRSAAGGRKHPHQELIQIDTSNILFICGGAFDGLEKIVEERLDRNSIGFNAKIMEKSKEGYWCRSQRSGAAGFDEIRSDS